MIPIQIVQFYIRFFYFGRKYYFKILNTYCDGFELKYCGLRILEMINVTLCSVFLVSNINR
ncbi:hypothetical protein T4A_5634 [Trichinella pseudospiralis]|uniref:Uncharacterized protein n=1 Tax=Trichinella pseudospiralis TaxID=6337 RepID=A0A0V1DX28_TRIPS|nr:hypothetical protein T4A_5634 [Trichinella pseudospiralis]KRZ32114.1 hypothetical protein T4C_7400 [Trichinella pseudospiralis]